MSCRARKQPNPKQVARKPPPENATPIRGFIGATSSADGGVRSGLDVVRLLALGARGVMIGRPWVWALGAAGEAGVAHVLKIIEAEMRIAMMLTGAVRVADIDRDLLAAVPRDA